MGYKLNNNMKGHRVGDFPHHVFYKGGLNETEEVPCENLWILENPFSFFMWHLWRFL